MVVDYGFLGSEGIKNTLLLQCMTNIRTGMLCANEVLGKGLKNVDKLVKDIQLIVYSEIILKSAGEPELINIQNEVQGRRQGNTMLKNRSVGDSSANGHAERAVQSFAGHVVTLKKAVEHRVVIKLTR